MITCTVVFLVTPPLVPSRSTLKVPTGVWASVASVKVAEAVPLAAGVTDVGCQAVPVITQLPQVFRGQGHLVLETVNALDGNAKGNFGTLFDGFCASARRCHGKSRLRNSLYDHLDCSFLGYSTAGAFQVHVESPDRCLGIGG
jgi:hypothetical protein